jgi:hypothetical protein
MPMMRDKFAVAIALGLVLGVLGLLAARGVGGDRDPAQGNAITQQDATATVEAEQREAMGEFLEGYPIKEYSSFEEAEAAAGYHILRSPAYPLMAKTTLRWFPQFARPASGTSYILSSPPALRINVEVFPSYFYADGDKTATSGNPVTVGGKAGWMLEDTDTAWTFVFQYGSVDGLKVWCQVRAVKKIGWEAFDHFVSTLQ